MKHDELVVALRKLRLPTISRQYAEIARIAEKEKRTYEQYLASLVQIEEEEKRRLRVARLLKEAKIPIHKRIDAYNFAIRTGITLQQYKRLAQGDFVRSAGNVVLYGDFGVGKTHLAIALTQQICEAGLRCYFASTSAIIEQLLEAKRNLTLAALLRRLDRFDLITCDELGYVPQDPQGADLFFQLISQRYERKSLLITTNLAYSEWDKVFLNPLSTAAAIDRIIHNCETLNIKGPSWRAQEAKKRMERLTAPVS
jgi:DNA replication protein DnaC